MTILTATTMAQLIAGSILFFAARTPHPATAQPAPKDTVQ